MARARDRRRCPRLDRRERPRRASSPRARAAGLSVVLRPGPHVNAELTSFGIPDHVLADPACLALTAHGTPAWLPTPPRAWPIPSYASTAFQQRVHAWYAAVAAVAAPHLAPDGPVVAIGVDNEAQMFFRLGAYDLDYHPDALAWWRDASGLEGAPPRAWDPADAARCVSWVRFKDQYIARALGDVREVARRRRLRRHRAVSQPAARPSRALRPAPASSTRSAAPSASTRTRRAPTSANCAAARPRSSATRRRSRSRSRSASGSSRGSRRSTLGAHDPTRERDHLLSLLAVGVRGFNLYMAVERDRWYGAAITKNGALESHATLDQAARSPPSPRSTGRRSAAQLRSR